MNRSAHTLADLQKLARSAPKKASQYLQSVETRLRQFGKTAEADAIKGLLAQTGTLAQRIAKASDSLQAIFPATAAEWATVQLKRADTLGYVEAPRPPPQFVNGTITRENGALTITTEGGRVLQLNKSPLSNKPHQMATDMLEGFVGDGPISLQGTIGEDNTSFNVEAFALNSDGQFTTFTFGRVTKNGESISIDSPRGSVEVTALETKRVLGSMPRLAVIMPGEAIEKNGKLVFEGTITKLIALARFKEPVGAPPEGAQTMEVRANMADNHFVMKPIEFPVDQRARAGHGSRLWVRGFPELDTAGTPTRFKADYLSQQLDRHTLLPGQESQSADHVQAAVMQDIV